MKNTIVVKELNKLWFRDISPEELENIEFSKKMHLSHKHLCSDCDNCYANKCVKVADEVKKSMDEYDFITSGTQVYNGNGEVDFFYVEECNNFKEDRKRSKPTTKEEIENLKRMKESIKIAYFDAENIDEADQTQADLFRRKQLEYRTYDYTFRK